jgi:hypothetical protein
MIAITVLLVFSGLLIAARGICDIIGTNVLLEPLDTHLEVLRFQGSKFVNDCMDRWIPGARNIYSLLVTLKMPTGLQVFAFPLSRSLR